MFLNKNKKANFGWSLLLLLVGWFGVQAKEGDKKQ
jgi:hypothetical protein